MGPEWVLGEQNPGCISSQAGKWVTQHSSVDEHYPTARHSTGVEAGLSRGAGVEVREGGTWDVTWGSGSGSAGIQVTHLLLLLV